MFDEGVSPWVTEAQNSSVLWTDRLENRHFVFTPQAVILLLSIYARIHHHRSINIYCASILWLKKDALNRVAYKELKFHYSRFNSVILFIISSNNLLRLFSEHMNYEL